MKVTASSSMKCKIIIVSCIAVVLTLIIISVSLILIWGTTSKIKFESAAALQNNLPIGVKILNIGEKCKVCDSKVGYFIAYSEPILSLVKKSQIDKVDAVEISCKNGHMIICYVKPYDKNTSTYMLPIDAPLSNSYALYDSYTYKNTETKYFVYITPIEKLKDKNINNKWINSACTYELDDRLYQFRSKELFLTEQITTETITEQIEKNKKIFESYIDLLY